MFKNLVVIGVAAGVGIVVGDLAADHLLKVEMVAKQNETLKRGARFGLQGIGVVVAYSLAKGLIK